MRTFLVTAGVLLGASILAAGCGSSNGSVFDDGNGDGSADGGRADGETDPNFNPNDGDGGEGNGEGGPACRTSENVAELRPVYLGFAFDVSGSMGQLDCPQWYHDPTKKWTPVVAATTEFLQDTTAVNMHASMVLFPSADATRPEKCAAAYQPEIAMTSLPSAAFATLLNAYGTAGGVGVAGAYNIPLPGGQYVGVNGRGYAWRGDTPTGPALVGTANYLKSIRGTDTESVYAIVLVTDGVPSASCGPDAATAAGNIFTDDGIRTYVIGVENPPVEARPATLPWDNGWNCNGGGVETASTPPANALMTLHNVAAAGSGDPEAKATLIQTGNATVTKDALVAEMRKIRAKSISCELTRPEPPTGTTFDPDKVNVRYDSQSRQTPLGYSADCAGVNAWRYKTSANDVIELCPSTCQTVQSDAFASIKVEFGCTRRSAIR